MKQLKFMLAAATAIGLATAAQADVNTYLVGTGADAKENFEDATPGDAATSLTGYSYDGATAADNESVVKAGGYNSNNALQVNTGTDPIVRDMNADLGTDIDMAEEGFKSLTIDTMVQFTVTPDGDTVTPGATDKLMIYLQEDLTEGAETTNLVVIAAGEDENGELVSKPYVVPATTLEVQPNTWYNLKVETVKLAYEDAEVFYPAFKISLAAAGSTPVVVGCPAESLTQFADLDPNQEYFPSLALVGAPDGLSSASLRYVGFAGEGLVDDLLVFRTDEGETSVDFTLALGTGVSAVTWTIDGVAQTDTLTGKVTAGQTIAITGVTYEDWYGPKGDYVKDWSGVWGTDVTADITVEAEEKATAADGNITVPNTTAPADLGITSGSAFYAAEASEAVAAELSKALTWAMSKGGATTASAAAGVVNGLAFDGDEETPAEKAYLLDCTEDKLSGEDGEIAKFKFAGFDPATGTFKVGTEKQVGDKAAYGNGYVEVRGSATVGGAYNEAADKSKHSFFKAFLVPFQPAAAAE